MSDVQIDVPGTRAAAGGLRGVVDLVEQTRRAVSAAATSVAFGYEHTGTLAVLDEIRDELGLTATLLGLTADAAETADGTYASMLAGWIASSASSLRAGINDGSVASVLSLLAGSGGTPGTIPPALAASLTPAAAATWFSSLPHDTRVALAAADQFAGTPVGSAIERWMAGLDGAELREMYTARALLRAGIDPEQWDPRLGLDHNAPTVEAVYQYYGHLYRTDPDRLWWSGMAALIGPSFYGGFRDLDTFRDLLGTVGAVAGSPLGAGLPPGVAPVASMSSDQLAAELTWYQLQLLMMQKEIFFDMAPAHEAYLDGGIDAIERLYSDDPHGFGPGTVDAWRSLDEGWRTGDADLVALGNRTLLLREQQYVIADDYERMYDRPDTGPATTWAMTLVGAPSIPGAQSYPGVFPLTVELGTSVSTPDRAPLVPVLGPLSPSVAIPHAEIGTTVEVVTPLPDGNIANFEDRWALIEQDTLPVYVDLARNHPDEVSAVLETPVGERADAYEIDERIDDILGALLTDWDLDADIDVNVGW